MRTISVTRIFNEDDIVEAFVRHNIYHLNHMIFLDNCSTDRTLEILQSLKDEGIPLSVFQSQSLTFDEVLTNTWMYQISRQVFQADWVIFLDADEFIDTKDKTKLSVHLDGSVLSIPLLHYGQTIKDNAEEPIVPLRLRWRQSSPTNVYKICINGNLGVELTVGAGNHSASLGGSFIEPQIIEGVALAHYPRRNGWQNLQKITVGWLKVLAAGKVAIDADRSSHYLSPFETLRDKPFELLGNKDYLDKELDFSVCEDAPLNYLGGRLLYTLEAEQPLKSFKIVLNYVEKLAKQHGYFLDSSREANQIVEKINSHRRFLF